MNRAVGTLYKGYPVLDRATFESRTVAALAATGGFNGVNGYNTPVPAPASYGLPLSHSVFWLYGFDASPFVTLNTSGEAGPDVWDTAGLAAAYRRALQVPGARFVFYGPRADFKDPAKDRVKVLYVRYFDVMVPIAAMLVYSASDWVGWRGGLEFVIAGTFGAAIAPFISGELGALVAGGTAPVEVGATQASLISSFSSSAAQLSGNKNVALIGSAINAYNAGGVGVAVDQSAAETARLGSYAQGNTTMWDAYDFTSGEADVALSDAQFVDYGFGDPALSGIDASGLDINGFGAGPTADPTFGTGTYDYNATPEVTTNQYGTQFDPQFGTDESAAETARLNAAEKLAATGAVKAATGTTGKAASSGGTSAKKPAPASNDMLATIGSAINNGAVAMGTAAQILRNDGTHAGQLTPQGGAGGSIAGIPTSYLMIGGAVLLLGALLLHVKG